MYQKFNPAESLLLKTTYQTDAIYMVPLVQKPTEDAKQVTYTDKRSLARTICTPGHTAKAATKGEINKEVEAYVLNRPLPHV